MQSVHVVKGFHLAIRDQRDGIAHFVQRAQGLCRAGEKLRIHDNAALVPDFGALVDKGIAAVHKENQLLLIHKRHSLSG